MEAKVLALVVIEANTLPDHEAKMAVAVSAAAVAMPIKSFAKDLITTKKQNLVGREESEKWQRGYRCQQICELSQVQWRQGRAATRRRILYDTHVGEKTRGFYL